jgi:hypothetical protein
LKIAIVGAQGTGKSWLANAIPNALAATTPGLDIAEPTSFVHAGPFDLVLLMGLDLDRTNDEAASALRCVREAQDAQLRADLARAGAVFHVVYGTGAARLGNALAAVQRSDAPILEASYAYSTRDTGTSSSRKPMKWQWHCDKCSDPDCEHRLFTTLAQSTATRLPIKD